MQTTLTVQLDDSALRRAEEYARRSGKSVPRMIEDFFALLEPPTQNEEELTPAVRSLLGAMSQHPVSEDDYHRHLEEKHR